MNLYKAAKCITGDPARYQRVQSYMDAVMGLMNKKSLRQAIEKDLDADKIIYYSLLPPAKDPAKVTEEALERAAFIDETMKACQKSDAPEAAAALKACRAAKKNIALLTSPEEE